MNGIIIACPQKYETICLKNILAIRSFGCELPIILWEINKEITNPTREKMKQVKNVYFRNIADITPNYELWKGFQRKAFILYHCKLDEVILCDADVVFYKNPEIVFTDANYLQTGAYFFKDLDKWNFYNLHKNNESDKFTSIEFFNKRKSFIKSLLPTKAEKFPKEWDYIYDNDIPLKPVKEALQESGVVYINKNKHKDSIEHIFQMNRNHKYVYQYIWGDKETFWLGCLMAKKKFYFNETSGYIHNGLLTHNYKNKLFWSQK